MDGVSEGDLVDLAAVSAAALLLVDAAGQVVFTSPAARTLLAQRAILAIREGVLGARRKTEHKALREALAAVSPGEPRHVLCLRSREGVPVMIVDLHRLASGLVALRVTDLAHPPVPSLERLKHAFGLTPAEARVASAMVSGLGLTAIASKYGVEAETVRSQAKRIRGKAGARSQNHLLGIFAAIGMDLGPR